MSAAETPEPECVPLTDEDRAILELECATVVGHVMHIVELDGPAVTAAELRARFAARLVAAPELRYRLAGTTGCPVWVPDAELDLEVHISDAPDPSYTPDGLRAFVAERFTEHLDRTRPLWSLDVAPLTGGGTALLWRMHHALADGATVSRLSRTVLYDEGPTDDAGRPATGIAVSPRATIRADHERRRRHLIGIVCRELGVGSARSPFDGTISTQRAVAFVDTDLPALHAAARAAGATVNDAVLSILAGGLRRWLDHQAGVVTGLRVRVPVSLPREDPAAGNRDSAFDLPLPLHLTDPLDRLRAVHELTSCRKDAGDAIEIDALLRRLAQVSPPVRRIVDRLRAGARAFAVSVSNVPGPRNAVAVLDRRVRALRPVVEIGFHHALRVGAASVAGTLSFGLCADPTLVPGLEVLADGLRAEADGLVHAVGSSGGRTGSGAPAPPRVLEGPAPTETGRVPDVGVAGAEPVDEYVSEIAETACGPVEYAVVGTGAPVLVVHGSPGGIDAAALMARILPRDRVRAILLSRPGYLGTELGGRATVDAQADLLAALLDHLDIDRAGVYTWSGGGPAGYRFAVRHPGRVTALVANAAVSRAYRPPDQDLGERLLFTTATGRWLLRVLAAHRPDTYIRDALDGEGDLTREQLGQRVAEVVADPAKRRFVLDLGPTAVPDERRRTGFRNDLDQYAAIASLELEKIDAPTLVVHGTADSDLPPAHGEFAADTIPGAELYTLDTGTHLALYTHPEAAWAQARVIEHLLRARR